VNFSVRGGAVVAESGVRARADVAAVSVSGVAWTGMAVIATLPVGWSACSTVKLLSSMLTGASQTCSAVGCRSKKALLPAAATTPNAPRPIMAKPARLTPPIPLRGGADCEEKE
jgi:hypothetical protein